MSIGPIIVRLMALPDFLFLFSATRLCDEGIVFVLLVAS